MVISYRYRSLTPFFTSLPYLFNEEGETIFKGRNELKLFHIHNHHMVVKSFQVPHFINRVAYAFFRKSKARRSYEYAHKLIDKGIGTPEPVAYIVERKYGLFDRSFYISLQSDCPGSMRELAYHPLEEIKDLVDAFARFTAELHTKQVLHRDYSQNNILYKKGENGYSFNLLDLNRIRFGKVSMRAGCYDLRRLWGSDETIAHIAQVYAEIRGFNPQKCVKLTLKYHKRFWKWFSKKHPEQKPYRIAE